MGTAPSPLSRRRFLLVTGGALVAAACGSGGGGAEDDEQAGTGAEDGTSSTVAGAQGLSLARVFSPEQPAGIEVRLPLALADVEGALLEDTPRSLTVRVGAADGELGPPVDVRRHDQAVPRPYYPLVTTFATTGTWRIVADADGAVAETLVTVRDRSELPAVPIPGEVLVPVPTPTTDDALGVDPICTAEPPCPLHQVSLDEALGQGRPVAVLVSTPAFCQTAICGPVLDLFVDRQRVLGDRVAMLHAEVYTDRTAKVTTLAVDALGLTHEPALFVADAAGTVVARLDYTFDAAELDAALALVA